MAQLHSTLADSLIRALGTMRGFANAFERDGLPVCAYELRAAARDLESAAAAQDEIIALMLKNREAA